VKYLQERTKYGKLDLTRVSQSVLDKFRDPTTQKIDLRTVQKAIVKVVEKDEEIFSTDFASSKAAGAAAGTAEVSPKERFTDKATGEVDKVRLTLATDPNAKEELMNAVDFQDGGRLDITKLDPQVLDEFRDQYGQLDIKRLEYIAKRLVERENSDTTTKTSSATRPRPASPRERARPTQE
jgi:hypothetical protein